MYINKFKTNSFCSEYDIKFSDKNTFYGPNTIGKTVIARGIFLALFGLTLAAEVNSSYKTKAIELFEKENIDTDVKTEIIWTDEDGNKYRIIREFTHDGTPKVYLSVSVGPKKEDWNSILSSELRHSDKIDEVMNWLSDKGITPLLISSIMTNETSQIGTVIDDEKLQRQVLVSWDEQAKNHRNDIEKTISLCDKNIKSETNNIDEKTENMNKISEEWTDTILKIYPDKNIAELTLNEKKNLMENDMKKYKIKSDIYEYLYDVLRKWKAFETKDDIKTIITSLKEKDYSDLSELTYINMMEKTLEEYYKILEDIKNEGGTYGIIKAINKLNDEKQKLETSKCITGREKKPIKCFIYPPENGKILVIELPLELSDTYDYDTLDNGQIQIPYTEGSIEIIDNKINNLDFLNKQYTNYKNNIVKYREDLMEKVVDSNKTVNERINLLEDANKILDKNSPTFQLYLKLEGEISEAKKLKNEYEHFKIFFIDYGATLGDEAERNKLITNKLNYWTNNYLEHFDYDIKVKVDNDGEIIITNRYATKDGRKDVERHKPSGAEKHAISLGYRYAIAKSFNFPLILDELDAFLDPENIKKTEDILNKFDIQLIVLTKNPNLKFGNVQEIIRTNKGRSIIKNDSKKIDEDIDEDICITKQTSVEDAFLLT